MKTKTADRIELLFLPSLSFSGVGMKMKEATSMNPTNEESLNLRNGTK